MTTSATYVPGTGVVLTIYGPSEGLSLTIGDDWTIAKLEHHIHDLEDWLS